MPWKEVSVVSQRHEFVLMAKQEDANISRLCAQFGISRDKGYKWLARFEAEGVSGLRDRSRRPLHSPSRTAEDVEAAVVKLRRKHPAWGGRKIRAVLVRRGLEALPAESTITGILHRHGLIDAESSNKSQPYKRFEHEAPNQLWQMDFKGHFEMTRGRCHPLTVLDDHSRFSLAIGACGNERSATVKAQLTHVFRRYGLPARMTMDNGPPWGSLGEHGLTPLVCWLIRLGIKVGHSRPYHPQTQGKDERFHRTLNAEVISRQVFHSLEHCQRHFDRWRDLYNLERPHEALDLDVPVSRYQPSERAMPDRLPEIEYDPQDTVRMVQQKGWLFYKNQIYRVPQALKGHPVALRQTQEENKMDVFFCNQNVCQIDLANPKR